MESEERQRQKLVLKKVFKKLTKISFEKSEQIDKNSLKKFLLKSLATVKPKNEQKNVKILNEFVKKT